MPDRHSDDLFVGVRIEGFMRQSPGSRRRQHDRQYLGFALAGLWIAISHDITGVLLCCTIIGIPFGIGSFRLTGLDLASLGKEIVKRGQEPAAATVVVNP